MALTIRNTQEDHLDLGVFLRDAYNNLRAIWRSANIHWQLTKGGYTVRNIVQITGKYMVEITTDTPRPLVKKSFWDKIIPSVSESTPISFSSTPEDYYVTTSEYDYEIVMPDNYIESTWNPVAEIQRSAITILDASGYDASASSFAGYYGNTFWVEVEFN